MTLRDDGSEFYAVLNGLAEVIDDVLGRWDAAVAPHLAWAELVWHRQEVAALRKRLDAQVAAVQQEHEAIADALAAVAVRAARGMD